MGWRNKLKLFTNTLLDTLLPRTCLACRAKTDSTYNICKDCLPYLPFIQSSCLRCGLPLASSALLYCGECIQQDLPYDHTFALFHYQPPICHFINRLKFHNQLVYGYSLGRLLAQRVRDRHLSMPLPEKLIPMPLHAKRLRERGYNQALIIAKPISQLLHIPIDTTSWQRSRYTVAQSSLPAKQRAKNVVNAFSFTGKQVPHHVAIIDDIMTTGSTISTLSQTLRAHGVTRIEVWCLARTVLIAQRPPQNLPHVGLR